MLRDGVKINMNKKLNAITLDILIMLILLAIVLGFTSFYIDQVMVRPVLQMNDQDTSLKCSFLLSQLLKAGYLREGEMPKQGTLKKSLLNTYNVTNENNINFGRFNNQYDQAVKAVYGNNAILIVTNTYIFNKLINKGFSPYCYEIVYGPITTGIAGIFNDAGGNINEEIKKLEQE